MAGDMGFDPLGISTTITELGGDLNYVREAELMHGRQAMLATVGFIAPSAFGKIIAADVPLDPLAAQYALPGEILAQLFVSIAIAEGLRSRILFSDGVVGEHLDDATKANLIKTFQLETPEKMMCAPRPHRMALRDSAAPWRRSTVARRRGRLLPVALHRGRFFR